MNIGYQCSSQEIQGLGNRRGENRRGELPCWDPKSTKDITTVHTHATPENVVPKSTPMMIASFMFPPGVDVTILRNQAGYQGSE